MTAIGDFPEMDLVLANQRLFQDLAPIPVHALPDRQYLEQAILPLLLHGLEATAKQRPDDPVEFLAAYLVSNNPQRSDPLPQMPHPMLYGAGFATICAANQSGNNALPRSELPVPSQEASSPTQSPQSVPPTSKK